MEVSNEGGWNGCLKFRTSFFQQGFFPASLVDQMCKHGQRVLVTCFTSHSDFRTGEVFRRTDEKDDQSSFFQQGFSCEYGFNV